MANQQLKRLLRRAPEMEEAEFELLQSRVLSRLTKAEPVAVEPPSANGTEPEPSEAVIDAPPSTNGEHPDPAPEPNAGATRVRSIKVTTYDVPTTMVGVMADAPLLDWDVAALPMIVQKAPRRVTKIQVADVVEPAEATVQPADLAEPDETIQPVESSEAVEPAEAIQAADVAEPAEAVQPRRRGRRGRARRGDPGGRRGRAGGDDPTDRVGRRGRACRCDPADRRRPRSQAGPVPEARDPTDHGDAQAGRTAILPGGTHGRPPTPGGLPGRGTDPDRILIRRGGPVLPVLRRPTRSTADHQSTLCPLS